jgi:CheY-like chemotaxis protein
MEDRIGKWVIRNRNKRRFLVVDDEPDLTMLCSLALEYYGFKVDTNISWLGEYIHSHI